MSCRDSLPGTTLQVNARRVTAVGHADARKRIKHNVQTDYGADIGADEVEVTEIMVAVGDKVELDQSIIAVEGDKASMDTGPVCRYRQRS